MKRFSWVLWCILAGMSYGCNNDVAIDPEVAKCIAVGGVIENGKCKCGELTNPGCKDENDLQYTCNKGILEIFECPDDSACITECPDNATCTKKCGITCQNGKRRCIKGIQVVCEDNTWNYEYKCATSCAESGDTCEKCDEQYLSCIDNIYARCENGVLIQGECPLGCDTKTKECKKCDTNETTCNGDDVLECKDGNWEKQETCGVWETCIGGECKCSDNVTKCDGTNMLQTCVDGKWNGGEPCPNGQICTDGACVENSGNGETPDTNQCKVKVKGEYITLENGNPICINNEDGIGLTHECSDGNPKHEKCKSVSCKCVSEKGCVGDGDMCGDCINNDVRCNNSNLEFCNDGNWEQVGPWGKVTHCVNNKVYHCTDDGNLESADCVGNCDGYKCQSCEDAITASKTWCRSNNQEGCNRASSVWNSGTYVACADNSVCKDETGCTTLNPENECQSYESLWEETINDDEKCHLNERMLQEIINRLKASNHNNNVKPQATFFIVSENQSYSFRVAANITDNYELYYSDKNAITSDENAITSKNGKLKICNIALPVDPYPDALLELKKSQISGIALELDADSEKCSTIVNIPNEEMSLICKNDESSKWTCNDNNVLMCANNKLYQLGFEGNDYYSWQSKSSIDYSEIDWDVSENIPWHTQNEELLCKINKNLINKAYEVVTDSHKYVEVKGENGSIKCELINDIKKCGDRSLEEICNKKILEISIWDININKETPRYSCQTDNLSISDLCKDTSVSFNPSHGCVFVTNGT